MLLRDEHIYELKKAIILITEERNFTVHSLKKRIDSLTAENEQLLCQLQITVQYEAGESHKYLLILLEFDLVYMLRFNE